MILEGGQRAVFEMTLPQVLRERRCLTVEHIRKLSRRFHVSPEVFF
jgi:antitoxin component HigA of HigAB toxin-antitoxin module